MDTLAVHRNHFLLMHHMFLHSLRHSYIITSRTMLEGIFRRININFYILQEQDIDRKEN